jgi:hypothetical protein
MTTAFVVCAVAGFAVALIGIAFDGVLDAFDVLDALPDWFSLPVLGAAVGAFGVAGLAVEGATDDLGTALVVATLTGLVFAAGAAWLTLALLRLPTDATPTSESVVGSSGRVVTPVSPGARGEVLLVVAGHMRKFTAESTEPLAVGEQVVAVESISDTAVRVMSDRNFWGEALERGEGTL